MQLIPAKFVQHHIPEEHRDNRMAVVIGSLGKISHVEIEINQSDMFFRGGWSQFLASDGITQANDLLLRYEGNMVFTVKVFGPDGCQREPKHKDIRIQQGEQKINMPMIVFYSFSSGYECEVNTEVHLSVFLIMHQHYQILVSSRKHHMSPFRTLRERRIGQVGKDKRNQKAPQFP